MKKRLRKPKIFNSLNIILLALIIAEFVFIINEGGLTGNPVKSVVLDKVSVSQTTNSLGTLVTKEGTVELIIQDNFERPELSKELYYLNENGKRFLLSTDSPLPVSAKIKVTGYLRDNTLSFSNSPTKDASLQGTSYTITSTTVEPWPKTLGDQKYAIVFLFRENENRFDTENYTNTTFGLANEYITETSYGKASVSYGYVGNFSFNESLCQFYDIFDYALNKTDPFVNFNDYDGLIVYHPGTSCTQYNGLANLGKVQVVTNDGIINLYKLWINEGDNPDLGTLIHEMGHNFGLPHARNLVCGEFPNIPSLEQNCYFWDYGDRFDTMGFSRMREPFSVRNKAVTLGWINNFNVLKVSEGTFFVSPFENDSAGTSKIQGIEVPILWNVSSVNWTNEGAYQEQIDLTSYYLEYRTKFNKEEFLNSFPELHCNDLTYGLNYSEIKSGLLIRLGRDSNYFYEGGTPLGYRILPTYILDTHPSTKICWNLNFNDCAPNYCETAPYMSIPFAMLLKNETYTDNFNFMNITVLDMNESGALVKITRLQTCTDTDGGINYNTKGAVTITNFSGTFDYQDICLLKNNLREAYCNGNNLGYSTYSCPSLGKVCSDGACRTSPSGGSSGGPSCYYDKIKRAYVCK